MKQWIKRGIALALGLALCLSLCSCNALDELKRTTGYWDGTARKGLTLDGAHYKLLAEELPDGWAISYDEDGYILQKDMPVLMAGDGNDYCTNKDRTILRVYSKYYEGYDGGYYVRDEFFDKASAVLASGDLDAWSVDVRYYDEESDEVISETVVLDEKTVATLKKVMESPFAMNEGDADFSFYDELSLNRQDADGLFQQYGGTLGVTNGGYFLLVDEMIYPVDLECSGVIEKVFKPLLEKDENYYAGDDYYDEAYDDYGYEEEAEYYKSSVV